MEFEFKAPNTGPCVMNCVNPKEEVPIKINEKSINFFNIQSFTLSS